MMATSRERPREQPSEERKLVLTWFSSIFFCLVVILWGAFVRFSRSGDGCGTSWPLCNGNILPNPSEAATLIEYTHRITSGFFGALVLILCLQSVFLRNKHPGLLRFALASLVFTATEALIGAGLVLREMVGDNNSLERALWLAGHLVNTLLLLGFLSAGGCQAQHREAQLPLIPEKRDLLALSLFIILAITGSLASLSNTLYPSTSLSSGLESDLSRESPLLVNIRILHPLFAILFACYGLTWTRRFRQRFPSATTWLSFSISCQVILGLLTLLLLSPLILKLAHLFLADLIWIQMVWLSFASTARSHKERYSHQPKHQE